VKRVVELELEYQAPIKRPPITPMQMQQQAAQNDQTTVDFWKKIWLRNTAANKLKFGSFKDRGVHLLMDSLRWKPAIVIGSGPSLKHYAKYLVPGEENGVKYEGNPGIPVLACLHNFAYLEDLGVHVDYYVTLDAGEVVIEEMFEGGKESKDFYRERSKSKKILAFMGTDPQLWNNFQGEVYFFNSIIPDDGIMAEMDAIEPYGVTVSSGGNVLGASMYIAKGILGCNPIIFMGADFSFSYEKKFHSWNSQYDVMGQTMQAIDVYSNKVHTWKSYYNFKLWFDAKAMTVPGIYINCSDGLFGSYPDGNIVDVIQMPIQKALEMYRVSDRKKPIIEDLTKRGNPLVLF
jgi:hypothetical protein